MDDFNDYLIHYGVKGMKWGVRRSKEALDRAAGRTKDSDDHKRARAIEKKKLSQMSNRELNDLLNRQNLEGRYRKANPGTLAKGSQAVKNVLAAIGTGVMLYNTAKSPAGKAAIDLGKRIVNTQLERLAIDFTGLTIK